MSYGTGIESILTSWRAIRTAIRNKGATLPDNTPIANWPAIIDGIETGSAITGATLVTGVAAEDITKGDPVVRKYMSDLTANFVSGTLDTPFTLLAYDVAFSPDSQYMAICSTSGLSVYKLSSGVWTLVYTETTRGGTFVGFSPSGKYLVVSYGGGSSLYLDVYKIEVSGVTYLYRTNIYPIAIGAPKDLVWAPDKDRVFIASPFSSGKVVLTSVDIVDDVTTVRDPSPPGLPSSGILGIAFSDDGLRLALGWGMGILIYAVNGDTYTLLHTVNIATTPDMAITFVPGSYDFIYTNTAQTPYLFRMNLVGDVYVDASFTTLTTNVGVAHLGMSKDGLYLFVPRTSTTIMSAYKLVDGVYTFFSTPKPTGTSGMSASFSPDGRWVAYAYWSSPAVCLAVYENLGTTLNIKKQESSVDTACATDIGFANEDALQGETVEMTSIIRNPSNYPA